MDVVKKLPPAPGVYLMKDARGRILYIGKAGNLRRRVASYWERPQEGRLEALLQKIAKIDYKKTDTALEALILEAALIKKHQPPYNVREKDDKSFLWVEITKEKWPRVLMVRGKGDFGPFTSTSQLHQALKIIRRIFPYNLHKPNQSNMVQLRHIRHRRPCLDYELGLCPGTCVDLSRKRYSNVLKNIRMIRLFFNGRKKQIIQSLAKEMISATKKLEYEAAEKIKRQIFALQHIQDIAFIGQSGIMNKKSGRIEGYDVSNISGASATGAMVVFIDGQPAKNQYRKFRIRNFSQPNDVAMLEGVLRRRFNHQEWPLPDLILVDGGRGQVNVAQKVLEEFGLKIPVVGIAKGPRRRSNKFTKEPKDEKTKELLIRIRDEAHRFAIKYHRHLSTATVLAAGKGVL